MPEQLIVATVVTLIALGVVGAMVLHLRQERRNHHRDPRAHPRPPLPNTREETDANESSFNPLLVRLSAVLLALVVLVVGWVILSGMLNAP